MTKMTVQHVLERFHMDRANLGTCGKLPTLERCLDFTVWDLYAIEVLGRKPPVPKVHDARSLHHPRERCTLLSPDA